LTSGNFQLKENDALAAPSGHAPAVSGALSYQPIRSRRHHSKKSVVDEVARYVSDVASRTDSAVALVVLSVLVEDKRYWSHAGFDPIAIARALVMMLTGRGRLQGGSTIPEQLAKQDGSICGRTLIRRLRRLLTSVRMTLRESKSELLVRYMRSTYFGRSAFGVEAAAVGYFGKSPVLLSSAECFFLVERIAAPATFRPARIKNILARKAIRIVLMDAVDELPEVYRKTFGPEAGHEVQRIVTALGGASAI
jgi:membrane peptidoglycan carboxypeptidase